MKYKKNRGSFNISFHNIRKHTDGYVSFIAEYNEEGTLWYYHKTIPDPFGDFHEKHYRNGKLIAEGLLEYSKIKSPEFQFCKEDDIPDSKFDFIIYV